MLTLENVEKIYRTERVETVALHNINLEVADGEFISIMGPSGSGKSTLLNIMGLLDVSTGGKLLLDGNDVSSGGDMEHARLRNRMFGFVFQTFHLVNDLSVVDNVEIPLLYRKLSGAERRTLALQALERVGLTSRVHHFPTQLSGGQQQRVAIARAVVGKPSIILADEPTGNLDSQMGDDIVKILLDLNTEDKTSVVMVTHDPRLAERTARTVRLFDGRQVS